MSGEVEVKVVNQSTGGDGAGVAVGVVLAVLVVIASITTIIAVILYRFVNHHYNCSISVYY